MITHLLHFQPVRAYEFSLYISLPSENFTFYANRVGKFHFLGKLFSTYVQIVRLKVPKSVDDFSTYVQTDKIAITSNNASITPTEGLLDLWLHGKSPHTQRYYQTHESGVLAFINNYELRLRLNQI